MFNPARLTGIGGKLAPLRDEGVLIVGSGFLARNLAALRQGGIPSWPAEFDDWGRPGGNSGAACSVFRVGRRRCRPGGRPPGWGRM